MLTRNLGEAITIGKNAEAKITVMNLDHDSVVLGVQAAREVPVFREEIYQQIQNGKRSKKGEGRNIK